MPKVSSDITDFDVEARMAERSDPDNGDYKYFNPGAYSSNVYNSISSTGNRSYSPKIYSIARDVDAGKAATMYSKTPRSAAKTYLRPSVSTKGSREAYKRQDI